MDENQGYNLNYGGQTPYPNQQHQDQQYPNQQDQQYPNQQYQNQQYQDPYYNPNLQMQQGYTNPNMQMQQDYANQGMQIQQGYMQQGAAPIKQKSGKGLKGFLIFMLIFLIAGGATVGGIFIGKALKSSDKDSGSVTPTSADKDKDKDDDSDFEYADGSFNYHFKQSEIKIYIDATDGKHITELRLIGVGDVDRPFPKNYENESQFFAWSISFGDISIALFYEEKGEKGSIYPADMKAQLSVYKDGSINADVYDLDVEVVDNEIIFKNIEIPEDSYFDLFSYNWGCNFYFHRNESYDEDVQIYDATLFINDERYDYYEHCLPSYMEEDTEATTEKKTTEDEKTTEQKTESTTADDAAGYNPPDENYFIQGTFISADPNLSGGSESTLIFYPNGSFYMNINFGEGFCEYEGTYSTSKKQSEMDDIYVYMTFNSTVNGIPKDATVVFSDTPDYCEFLTAGFGLIGYGDPPYGFNRVD